ncbi:hypothetical protein OUZ56_008149 [Daphnia magna]|uniref:Uncharacterized protein n=1 Tax=Daphnia magna TaxID=35525 RepID=A0ABR0AC62_9CRUS|nr:hypothetical protein OUZ56_008149 [Daphnia magna]
MTNSSRPGADIYDKVQEELEAVGFDTECLGGGRIMHDSDKRSIQVYGYSQGFGLADHAVTTELLKARYPGYESITWTNEEEKKCHMCSRFGTMDGITVIFILWCVATQPATASLSCRTEDGQPVDWFRSGQDPVIDEDRVVCDMPGDLCNCP